MKTEKIAIGDTEFELFLFDVPMFHEAWHEVERLELTYVGFDDSGNDYWDYEMVFCKREFENEVQDWWIKTQW